MSVILSIGRIIALTNKTAKGVVNCPSKETLLLYITVGRLLLVPIFLQDFLVEEGLPTFLLELILNFDELPLAVLKDVLVLLLDLLAGLVGEVVLQKGEVSSEANDELHGAGGTSHSRFSSLSDHFLL